MDDICRITLLKWLTPFCFCFSLIAAGLKQCADKQANQRLTVQDKHLIYFCSHTATYSQKDLEAHSEKTCLMSVARRRKCCHSRVAADSSSQRNMSSKYSSNSSSLDRYNKENPRSVSSCCTQLQQMLLNAFYGWPLNIWQR